MNFAFPFARKVVRKKKFTREEDNKLRKYVNEVGEDKWEEIANLMGNRNARQCHDRWKYYLSPKVNNEPFTKEEDELLIKLVSKYGGMWVQISKKFKNRSDIQMKNRWNILKKQFNLMSPSYSFQTDMMQYQVPMNLQMYYAQQSAIMSIPKVPKSRPRKESPAVADKVTPVAEIKHNTPLKEEKTYNQILLDLEIPDFEF